MNAGARPHERPLSILHVISSEAPRYGRPCSAVSGARGRDVRIGDAPLRILHLIASVAPRYGGPSAAVFGMCTALSARGHDVEIVTTDIDGPTRLEVPTGIKVIQHGVPITYWPVQPPRSYKFSIPLARDLSRRLADFDVVHVHSLFLFHGAVARALAHRAGVPYLVRPHGTLDPYHRGYSQGRKAVYWRLVEHGNLQGADGIHYTSEAERIGASDLGLRPRAFVVPLGVAIPDTNHATARALLDATFPLLAGSPIVTFLGRLTPKKRLPLVLEAFSRVEDQQACLVLAGPDNEGLETGYREQAARLGIGHRTVFTGPVAGELKDALLASSSVFVLPSYDENMGVAVLEAMASGVPVIVSEGVALHTDIREAAAGIVAEPNAEALAWAMERVLGYPEAAAAMGSAGRALVSGRYSWDAVGQQLEQMYRTVIKASKAR